MGKFHIARHEQLVQDGQSISSFVFGGKAYEWSCGVLFEDPERQRPKAVDFYIWHLGNESGDNWGTLMAECLSHALGYPVKLSELSSGNGHGNARIARVPQ